jgi:predicted RNase H-like HicB family nuclease
MNVRTFKSLDEYINAAVTTARFERIEAGQKIYAELPGFRGVWAQGRTRQEVVKELREVLSGWIELQLERGSELPPVKGAKFDALTFA